VRASPVQGFSHRKVGIVPRDEDEHQRLTEALDALVQTTNGADIVPTTVRVDVRRGVLTSEKIGPASNLCSSLVRMRRSTFGMSRW
jgi:hypothetical protein